MAKDILIDKLTWSHFSREIGIHAEPKRRESQRLTAARSTDHNSRARDSRKHVYHRQMRANLIDDKSDMKLTSNYYIICQPVLRNP